MERRACVVRTGWTAWIGATQNSSFTKELATSIAVDYEIDDGSGMAGGTVSTDLTSEDRKMALSLLKERCSFITHWLYLRESPENWDPYLWSQ